MPPRKAAYKGAVVGGPRCPIRVRKDDEMTVDTTTPRELALRIKKKDGTPVAEDARIEFRINAGEHKAGKSVTLTCALIEEERFPLLELLQKGEDVVLADSSGVRQAAAGKHELFVHFWTRVQELGDDVKETVLASKEHSAQ